MLLKLLTTLIYYFIRISKINIVETGHTCYKGDGLRVAYWYLHSRMRDSQLLLLDLE